MRTKIVCTIGPAVDSLDKMIALIDAGMNVARLNFSHGSYDEHKRRIDDLKKAREKTGQPLAIMLDTKGPEVRVGELSQPIPLKRGQVVTLAKEAKPDNLAIIPIVPASILDGLKKGTTVLFDDGYISSRVVEVTDAGVLVEILDGGTLKSRKGINVPGAELNLPMVTEKDYNDIAFGCEHDVDLIAASFVCSAEHILEIRRFVAEKNASSTRILAKIETRSGIENIDGILQAADGIMVARGDLGVEVPLSEVPILQKMLIRKCYEVGKPSIVATQMLESMITNPRPTRAEASDVANAIYDSGSAVMLSGETAIGEHPIETVRVMRQIINAAEEDFDYTNFLANVARRKYHDISSSVGLAAIRTAVNAGAKAIFSFTSSGKTVRLISTFRPKMPILAMTTSEKVYHQLAFNWGVVPILEESCTSLEEAYTKTSAWALENGHVRQGDLVVVTAGVPFGVAGTTNMMVVESIGNVLVRGTKGFGERVTGKVRIVYDPVKLMQEDLSDQILIITKCEESDLPLIKKAAGVLLQNHFKDPESEQYLMIIAKALGISAIAGADFATELLKEGQEVILDPQDALVYGVE